MKISIYQEIMWFLKKHNFLSSCTTAYGFQRFSSPKYTKSVPYLYWAGNNWNSVTYKSKYVHYEIISKAPQIYFDAGGHLWDWDEPLHFTDGEYRELSEKLCLIKVPPIVKFVKFVKFDSPCLMDIPGVPWGLPNCAYWRARNKILFINQRLEFHHY